MFEVHNQYALDGPDPNSWSEILRVLKRWFRPWSPGRQIVGELRHLRSRNTDGGASLAGCRRRRAPDGAYSFLPSWTVLRSILKRSRSWMSSLGRTVKAK